MPSVKILMLILFGGCELMAGIGLPKTGGPNLTALGLFFLAIYLAIGTS